MKKLIIILWTGAAIGMAGCGGGKTTVDADKLNAAFESSSSSAKPAADQAVKNIRSGDYVGAMKALTEAAGMGELSDDQRQAIYDVITEVQIKVAKEAPGNAAEINDAIAALDAALTGRPLSTENPMEFMKPPTAGQQP